MLIAGVLVVTFSAHMAYGANKSVLGLMLASAEAILLLAALATSRFSGELWAERRTPMAPGVIFLGVLALTSRPLFVGNALGLEDLSGVVSESIKLSGLGCIFLLGRILGSRLSRGETFLKLTGVLLGVYAVYAIAAFKLAPDQILFGPRAMFFDRLTGSFGSANSAATLLGMGVVLNASLALAAEGGRSQTISAAAWSAGLFGAALACGAALLMTASRGGFLSTVAGLAVVALFALILNGRRGYRPAVIAVIAAGGLAIALLAWNSFLGRRLSETTLNLDRFEILKGHWPLAVSHWAWGFGAGGFDAVNNLAITPSNYALFWNIRATHNVFVQWIEETGAPSLALMVIVLGFVSASLFLNASKKARRPQLAVAVLAASTVVIVHGLSDFALQNPSIAALWSVLLGLASASALRAQPLRR